MRTDRAGFNWENVTSAGVVHTAGQVFPDGQMLDLVADPASAEDLKLVHWDGDRALIADRIKHRGATYAPISLDIDTRRAIHFPSEPRDYGSARELFGRLLGLLDIFSDLRRREQCLVAYFILSSWFPEALPMASGILIRGPSQADALRLLRLLACVCRRGLCLTELTAGNLCVLPLSLMPTLLLDQMRMSRSLAGLLRGSAYRGSYFASAEGLQDLYCLKAIFFATNHVDSLATQSMLHITIPPGTKGARMLDEGAMERIRTELQPRLLQYRLQNYRRVRESSFDAPDFTPAMRDLARGLAASIADDTELANEVISLLAPEDEDERARSCLRPEFAIILAVLALVHERKLKQVKVKEMSNLTNTVLHINEQLLEFSPEEVGYRLRALGLFTVRTGAGKVLKLDAETSRLVHALARQYGVPIPTGGFPDCSDCQRPAEVPENRRLVQGVQGV